MPRKSKRPPCPCQERKLPPLHHPLPLRQDLSPIFPRPPSSTALPSPHPCTPEPQPPSQSPQPPPKIISPKTSTHLPNPHPEASQPHHPPSQRLLNRPQISPNLLRPALLSPTRPSHQPKPPIQHPTTSSLSKPTPQHLLLPFLPKPPPQGPKPPTPKTRKTPQTSTRFPSLEPFAKGFARNPRPPPPY
ncbi:uncharacterized protein LOC126024131 [Suncus etruscus]|uniref:uncharacterized protein LOC126024131 n=1 Tax=Suncus etruscus TaxID=109475 RepID=UPI002110DC56|nr:uncharacterized protein LOC126024131 [Suncus etruscus]